MTPPPSPSADTGREQPRDLTARLRRGVRELDAAYTLAGASQPPGAAVEERLA